MLDETTEEAEARAQTAAAAKAYEEARSKLTAINEAVRREYKGRFVRIEYSGIRMEHHILPAGHAELDRYGLEWVEDIPDGLWFNDGVAYRAESVQCLVCESTNVVNTVQHGMIGPRYAACARHDELIWEADHIRKRGAT